MAAPSVVTGAARGAYRTLLRLHGPARQGYGPQMLATFDALIDRAGASGTLAVLVLLIKESAGLLASRRMIAVSPGLTPPRRPPLMRNVSQDLKFAVRTFRRRPALTAAIVTTLALGIGANVAIFSVTNAVLLQRLPFPNPSRLVAVWEDASAIGFPRNTPAPGNYADWTTSIPAFEGVGAISMTDFNLIVAGEPVKIGGALATASLFKTLDARPALGRVWQPDEDRPGNHIAVINHSVWKRQFGGDPGIINRTVNLSGIPYTIVGVMPERFEIVDPDLQIWTPLGFTADRLQDRNSHYLWVIARLRDGATVALANAQLHALATRLQIDHPDSNHGVGMYAVPLLDDYIGDTRTALVALVASVGCLLLIVCVNVANLLLTQAAGRAREMAVRTALGADRRRLVRQLLTESLLLSLAGGTLGVIVAVQTFPLLALLIPHALSGLSHVTLDVRVLVVTATVSIATGVLFGLAPAWRGSRVEQALARANRASRGVVGSGSPLRSGLVVTEIALATVVLVGAALLVESFQSARAVPLGFQPEQVLTMRVPLPRRAYADPAKRTLFVDHVLERVRALPGVVSAGYAGAVPLVWKGGTSGFLIEGMPRDPSLQYDASSRPISPGYMETLGLTLRAGRFFDARDSADGTPVGIINEAMAHLYWPGMDPVGRRFRIDGPNTPWRTIVGIVGDTRVMGIEQPTRPEMYFPIAQSSDNWMWPRDLAVRAGGDPRALIRSVSAAIWSIDREQPISNIDLMDDIVARELQERRLQATFMATFAALALVLAAVGIYGVLSYSVTERTAEIGVRLALGGDPARILARFVGRGLALAALGLTIGLVAAFWGASLIDRLLFNVRAHDVRVFAAQALVIVVVCLAAVYLPARRASRVDPIAALRAE
ncbi:MAG TPA: ABC transporter permease [Vicinamibacterales bacterium]|nr:ABC transporter permease [Vicinamibacterales bacterium]